ncbi:hypothetical protein OC846_001073 [Tilletia horrida]|uniref:Uncharacterized protein n=1 Tax=Tilletia horrida TaxID=155126 RepID=A0AAN6K081_9BASI|nr:hypothetical protein OC845_003738 [Tilletia horrida]KAK0556506.1 hypothetical protein OC846_001073 [Tilletia horrida]KAK0569351.1 hypothetical protein OC861_001065 [Tilletia horrida]
MNTNSHNRMHKVVRTSPQHHESEDFLQRSSAESVIKRAAQYVGDDLVKRDQVNASACRAGALYVAPAAGAVVDSAQLLTIEWNKDCLTDQSNIDIYVINPGATTPLAGYRNIPAGRGSYQIQLHPYWWGGTAQTSLSINIVKSGNQVWDSPNPVGLPFTATYAVPGPGQPVPKYADPSDSKIDRVINYFYAGGGLTPGGKAAAIICPLVVVLCGLGVYIRKHHINRFNKTADWANKMDQRMSRISVDWDRGGDGSGGAVPGSRPASYFPRPSLQQNGYPGLGGSQLGHRSRPSQGQPEEREMDEMVDDDIDPGVRDAYGGLAGLGAQSSLGHRDNNRISFAASTAADRRSRISFAPESTEGHASGVNRHRASASLPRVGQNNWRRSLGGSSAVRDSYADSEGIPEVPKISTNLKSSPLAGNALDKDDFLMSPTQHEGPRTLGQADLDLIRPSFDSSLSSVAGGSKPVGGGMMNRQTMDSTLSHGYFAGGANGGGGLGRLALAGENDSDAYSVSTGAHLAYTGRASPPPQLPSLPQLGGSQVQTGMAPPANTSSPDDAMRAYAAARTAGGNNLTAGPSGMRNLFAAVMDDDSTHRASPSMGGSLGGSSLNEDDVVGYNEAAAASR